MGNLLISGRHSIGKSKRQVAPERIDALLDYLSTCGLRDDDGVTSRHRRNRLFTPRLENFPFWKTRSWEIRIGRQANSGVVREPSAFRLAKFQQFSSLTSHRHGQNSGNAKRKEKPEDPTSRPVKLLPCAQSKQTEFLLRSAGAQHIWIREIRLRYR